MDDLEIYEHNSKILIGYLWYFMTTFLSYTAEDFNVLEDVMNPSGIDRNISTEGIIGDLKDFSQDGIGAMADVILLMWKNIPLLEETPHPVAKKTWYEAWSEFIQELPIEEVTKMEMIDDIENFFVLDEYVDYMKYVVENPYPHDTEIWYNVFIPLLDSTSVKK